jgi:hypothetical protein
MVTTLPFSRDQLFEVLERHPEIVSVIDDDSFAIRNEEDFK